MSRSIDQRLARLERQHEARAAGDNAGALVGLYDPADRPTDEELRAAYPAAVLFMPRGRRVLTECPR